jgi:hypothetical protein
VKVAVLGWAPMIDRGVSSPEELYSGYRGFFIYFFRYLKWISFRCDGAIYSIGRA